MARPKKGSAVSRELASTAREFDPAEISRAGSWGGRPPIGLAILPLVLVVVVNLILTQFVLPSMDFDFLSQPAWGETTLSAVGGVWSVALALLVACIVLVAMNRRRFRNLRESIDSGATAAVLPIMSVASLVSPSRKPRMRTTSSGVSTTGKRRDGRGLPIS
jgi:H+/gluconate symporter-like permease